MTDRDRIMKAARDHGWAVAPSPVAVTIGKPGTRVAVRFAGNGTAEHARIDGREVKRDKAAAVIKHLREH